VSRGRRCALPGRETLGGELVGGRVIVPLAHEISLESWQPAR